MELYRGIGHVAYDCSDLEQSLDFYCNKMGFTRLMHLGDDNNPWLIYLKIAHGVYMELFPRGHEVDPSAGHYYSHLCLEVFDIVEAVRVLREKGVTVEDPHKGQDGNYQAWLSDPDSNRIELMQMMPDSKQRMADPR